MKNVDDFIGALKGMLRGRTKGVLNESSVAMKAYMKINEEAFIPMDQKKRWWMCLCDIDRFGALFKYA